MKIRSVRLHQPLVVESSPTGPIHQRTGDRKFRFTRESARLGIHCVRYLETDRNSLPLHSHQFLEISFIWKGSGWHLVEKERFPLKEGDVLFIDNRFRHAFSGGAGGMEITNLCFLPTSLGIDSKVLSPEAEVGPSDLLLSFRRSEGKDAPMAFRPDPALRARLEAYTGHLIELLAEKDSRNHEAIRQLTQFVLSILLKERRKRWDVPDRKERSLDQVAHHLRAHSHQKVSIPELAERMGISRSYFSTLFNRSFGKSIREFLDEVRVEKIRAQMANSSLSSWSLAVDQGFESKSHFHKVFFRLTGETPERYRDRVRGGRNRGSVGTGGGSSS